MAKGRKATISLEMAKALELKEGGSTGKVIGLATGRTPAAVRNSLLKWPKAKGILTGKVVDWSGLLELIDSADVLHDPRARELVQARADDRYWDPDTGDLFDRPVGEQEDTGGSQVREQKAPKADTDRSQVREQKAPKADTGSSQARTGPFTGMFTPDEVLALKRVALREISAPDPQRAGRSEVVRMRIDGGLLAALREHAKRNGLRLAEALGRAVALYLQPEGRTDAT